MYIPKWLTVSAVEQIFKDLLAGWEDKKLRADAAELIRQIEADFTDEKTKAEQVLAQVGKLRDDILAALGGQS